MFGYSNVQCVGKNTDNEGISGFEDTMQICADIDAIADLIDSQEAEINAANQHNKDTATPEREETAHRSRRYIIVYRYLLTYPYISPLSSLHCLFPSFISFSCEASGFSQGEDLRSDDKVQKGMKRKR